MTPLELLLRSEAAVQLAGLACAVGSLAGAGLVLLLGWRRLTRVPDGTVRMLRLALDDAQASRVILQHRGDELARLVSAKQHIIDDLSSQVTQLHKDCDRIARTYVERAAHTQTVQTGARRPA